MSYFGGGDFFSDIYEPSGSYEYDYGHEQEGDIELNVYEDELYEKALEAFIDYLEEKQNDRSWLAEHQDLVISIFCTLFKSEDSHDLLPAIKLLDQDPEFAEKLDAVIAELLILHNTSPQVSL
jgi:hypothetical protein